MRTTEMLDCARGKTLKHTRRFVGNIHGQSYLPGRLDEVETGIIGDKEPKILSNGEGWNISVGGSIFCYDVDPETPHLELAEVEVQTGSGNRFVDTFEILSGH